MRIHPLLLASASLVLVASPVAGQRAFANVSVTVVSAATPQQLGAPDPVQANEGFTDYEGGLGIHSPRGYAVAVRLDDPRPGVTVLLADATGGLTELGASPVLLDSTGKAVTADSIRCRLLREAGADAEAPIVLTVAIVHP